MDLDQWRTVSPQYDATIRRAEPLRQVETVTLRYAATKKLYVAVIVYKEAMKADPKEEPVSVCYRGLSDADVKEHPETMRASHSVFSKI